MEKIDFLIPWVDSGDENWRQKKAEYDVSKTTNYDNANMRYRDWGTLKYVLRGIEKNCPWYNKIYIVTQGHYPDWLDIEHPKIKLITHDELYYDVSDLPVFSSSSIEMNLPNIKGLSNHFVYCNDDTFFLKPLNRDRFFKNGLPVDYFSHGWIPRNKLFEKLRGMNSWAHSCKNNIDLINRKFTTVEMSKDQLYHQSYSFAEKVSNFLYANIYKKLIWVSHYHQPMPYLKQTLLDVRAEFEKEMRICSKNRFRRNNDLTQYIYRYWHLASGEFYPFKHYDNKYHKIENREDIDKCLAEMDNYALVCVNDSVSDEISKDEVDYIEKSIISKLNELLPHKASFEK